MARRELTNDECRRYCSTPWGAVQYGTRYADGLDIVSTAGHGGAHLDVAHAAKLRALFPGFNPWTGSPEWLEEDCDLCAVLIAFPEYFAPGEVFDAIRMVRGMAKRPESMWVEVVSLIDSSPELLAIERQEAERTRDLWERGSMGTCFHKGKEYADCWWVSFRRGNATTERIVRGYPDKKWYTDDELAALETA